MDYQTFLQKVIAEMPSHVFDSSVYVCELNKETEECIDYKIVDITNESNNDAVFIYIKRS